MKKTTLLLTTFGLLSVSPVIYAAFEYSGTTCGEMAETDCTDCMSTISLLPDGEKSCNFMQGSTAQVNVKVCVDDPESTDECSNDHHPTVIGGCTDMTKWICETVDQGEDCDLTSCGCGGEQNDGTGQSLMLNGYCTD